MIILYRQKRYYKRLNVIFLLCIFFIAPLRAFADQSNTQPDYSFQPLLRQIAETPDDTYFRHKEGVHFSGLMTNGMQKVHGNTQIIYLPAGATKQIYGSKETVEGYVRWYNYDTDGGLPVASSAQPGYVTKVNYTYTQLGTAGAASDRGFYYCNKGSSGKFPTLSYTQTNPAGTFRIGCDQSVYIDYLAPSGSSRLYFTEPTLSQRTVFEIRPAQEMADSLSICTGDKFLEEYTIMAPAAKKLRVGPQYTCTNTSTTIGGISIQYRSNYYISATQQADTVQWHRNGTLLSTTYLTKENVQPTNYQITNGRLLQLTGGAAGSTDTITLTSTQNGTTYNIARFIITYQADTEIGPLAAGVISDQQLAEEYTLITERTFDFGKPTVDYFQPYDTTLALEESYYGYGDLTSSRPTRCSNRFNIPCMGEYFFANALHLQNGNLINNSVKNIGDIAHRSGAKEGYFLVVDADNDPGVAMELNFDANFCPNTNLAFSAWIADVDTRTEAHIARANLNLVVIGIDQHDNEYEVVRYTTGDMKNTTVTKAEWQQVFFTIPTDDKYIKYRLKIINNSWSSIGNNLAMDDIQIFIYCCPIKLENSKTVCFGR